MVFELKYTLLQPVCLNNIIVGMQIWRQMKNWVSGNGRPANTRFIIIPNIIMYRTRSRTISTIRFYFVVVKIRHYTESCRKKGYYTVDKERTYVYAIIVYFPYTCISYLQNNAYYIHIYDNIIIYGRTGQRTIS